jgi:hypothetical protein
MKGESNGMKAENSKVSDAESVSNEVSPDPARKTWEAMKLTYAGEARDIVRGGSGKIGITQADLGDTNKPKGGG